MPHRGGGARELASEKGAEPCWIEAVGLFFGSEDGVANKERTGEERNELARGLAAGGVTVEKDGDPLRRRLGEQAELLGGDPRAHEGDGVVAELVKPEGAEVALDEDEVARCPAGKDAA